MCDRRQLHAVLAVATAALTVAAAVLMLASIVLAVAAAVNWFAPDWYVRCLASK